MGMGTGGIQSLASQLNGQGGLGSSYVNPSLTGQQPMGGGMSGLGSVGTPPAGGPNFGSMGAPNMQQPGNPGFPDPYVQGQMNSAKQAMGGMPPEQFEQMKQMLQGGMQPPGQIYETPGAPPVPVGQMLGGGMQPPSQMSNMNSSSPGMGGGFAGLGSAMNSAPRQMPQGMGGGFAGLGTPMAGSAGARLGGMRGMRNMGGMRGMLGGMRGPQATPTAMFAEGGLAGAAQNMAGRGRDGDSMLVHMSPGEVKGLQALAMAHGGSLSINPDTGLVEASFLKKILPMIAGAGLMMIPGVNALAAAGMVGGVETLRTGDIGKGLMAGLGAYGGAGLAQGLSAAGGTAAGLESGAGAVGSDAATMGTTEGMTKALTADTGVGSSMGINSFDAANIGQTPLDPTKVTNFADAYSKGAAPSLTNMGRGIGELGSEVGRSAVYNGMPTGTMLGLGSTAVNALTPEMPPPPGMPEEEERYKGSPYRYNLSPNFSGASPTRPNPYYRPAGLGYAAGGDIMMADGGSYDDEPMGDVGMAGGGSLKMKTMSLGDGIYKDTDDDTANLGAYDAAQKRMEKQFAAANLKPTAMPKARVSKLGQIKTGIAAAAGGSIGGYSDGGRMLKGPGDGMSDSIPAMIGKRQPARLADGEFVVPADVVSHLGNGSTDAGAKKLYSMMDKIRHARTGKKKQAPAVKANKYLPA